MTQSYNYFILLLNLTFIIQLISQSLQQVQDVPISLMSTKYNIFQQAVQLISLDCSSITGETINISQSLSQSLHNSILNLKSVLPTFTSQFQVFKEQIMESTYYMVNKLMNLIKHKNTAISKLEEELQKSQSLTNSMRKQVIQLKQMISQFMQSYGKQIEVKQQQILVKNTEIEQLKGLLKQKDQIFNGFRIKKQRNTFQCDASENKKSQKNQIKIQCEQQQANSSEINDYFQNYSRNKQNFIQMSESIVCTEETIEKKMSLQIIQEENSDVNSLTDYLQSQRVSLNAEKEYFLSRQISQVAKSTRSGQNKKITQQEYADKSKNIDQKNGLYNNSFMQERECQNKRKSQNIVIGKINIMIPSQQRNCRDNFSCRNVNKKASQNQNQNGLFKDQNRRTSEPYLMAKDSLDGYKIERKPVQRKPLRNLNNDYKFQLHQQLSQSSSLSDIGHLGDTDKIQVNYPKKLESPKNMSFIKKNSSRTNQRADQRFKTEPSPRERQLEMNKQNVKIESLWKPVERNKKILTRKKTILTQSKNNQTSKNQQRNEERRITIKHIQSPQKLQKFQSKSTHLFKNQNLTTEEVLPSQETVLKNNFTMFSSTGSNISIINDSNVKSHHQYHSAGKHNIISTSKHTSNPFNSLQKNQIYKQHNQQKSIQKHHQRKSSSKSKQKLKVTSKNTSQFDTIQKQQKFINQMNSCYYSAKMSSKAVKKTHFHAGITKVYLKNNLLQIKNALKYYDIASYLASLKQVHFDVKMVNGQKQGYGKVVYDNGFIYEGGFNSNKRQGQGKINLNGVNIYEGQFLNNNIEGQGYLKCLRLMSYPQNCHKVLGDSSYFGGLVNNKFDGMGTLFLNSNQKIVTKFKRGVPFGELTFYTQNDIEFGHWPSQQ